MPMRDGTGPMGAGPVTGRGLGICTGTRAAKCGAGFGLALGLGLACRRGFRGGFGRNSALNQDSVTTQKGLLQEQKELLQIHLQNIEKQLKNL